MLAALSDDGEQVTLWNVEHRQRFETIALGDAPKQPPASVARPGARAGRPVRWAGRGRGTRAGGNPAAGRGARTRAAEAAPAPGRQPRFCRDRLALAGHILAVVRPDNDGIRLFDVRTGSRLHDLNRPGRRVISVLANPASERLLTDRDRLRPGSRQACPGSHRRDGPLALPSRRSSRLFSGT